MKSGTVKAQDNTMHITGGAGDSQINITGGQVSYVYVTSTDTKFNQAISGLQATSIGQMNTSYIVELGEKLYDGELKLYKGQYDDFGRPACTWTYKNDKIGTYANKSELIATYTAKVSRGEMYNLLSSSVRSALTAAPSKFNVTVDGVPVTSTNAASLVAKNPAAPANYWERANSDVIYKMPVTDGTNGVLTEVYLDIDNNVDIVIINTYAFKATGDYSSARDEVRVAPVGDTKITLASLALKGEDVDVADVKDGDYLLITGTRNSNGTYDAQSVKIAEKVTGPVTTYTKDDSVTIDGTKYSYSAICAKTGDGKDDTKSTDYTVGQDAIVVLDAYKNVIVVDEARASSSYVFIDRIASTSGLNTVAKAAAYFTDGTSAEITLREVNGVKSASTIVGTPATGENSPYDKMWWNYSVNSEGAYTLYPVNTTKYAVDPISGSSTRAATATSSNNSVANSIVSQDLMKNGKVEFLLTGGTDGAGATTAALGNDKTIAVVKDNTGDLNAYVGIKTIPDVKVTGIVSGSGSETATAYYLKNDKGYVDYVFVNLDGVNSSVAGGNENSALLYIARKAGNTVYVDNSRQYTPYDAVNADGEKIPLRFDAPLPGGTDIYTVYYKTRADKNDDIIDETVVPDGGGTKYFNKTISAGSRVVTNGNGLDIGGHNFMLSGDSKVVLVARQDCGIPMDTNAKYEVFTCPGGVGLESYFNGYTFAGNITGSKLSSTSDYIDTLFITVNSRAADAGSFTMTFAPASASVEVGASTTVNYSVTNASAMTIGTPYSGNTGIATVSTTGTAITITGVSAGSTTVTVPVSNASGVPVNQSFSVTVTNPVPAATKLANAKTAIDGMTSAQKNLPADTTSANAAARAKAAVEALSGVSADVTVTENAAGTWTAATGETAAGVGGSDATYAVVFKLSATGATDVTTTSITFTVPGTKIPYAETPAGKIATAKTAIAAVNKDIAAAATELDEDGAKAAADEILNDVELPDGVTISIAYSGFSAATNDTGSAGSSNQDAAPGALTATVTISCTGASNGTETVNFVLEAINYDV